MATLVITIVTPDSVAMVTDQLQGVGTISHDSSKISILARYLDGIAESSFGETSTTTAVS
jgi:hypothetical protein